MKWTFLKFIGVGGCATIIHYGCYLWLLNQTELNPVMANMIAFFVSFGFNFILTHVITFQVKFTWRRSVGFIFTHGMGFLINQISFCLLSLTKLPSVWIPLFVFPLVTFFNFTILQRIFKCSVTDAE